MKANVAYEAAANKNAIPMCLGFIFYPFDTSVVAVPVEAGADVTGIDFFTGGGVVAETASVFRF